MERTSCVWPDLKVIVPEKVPSLATAALKEPTRAPLTNDPMSAPPWSMVKLTVPRSPAPGRR
jgi:hypothetical protein